VLGAHAAPLVRDGILGSALSRAGLVAVPDDGSALDGFVRGPFRTAIEERLGGDVADAILTELWPLIAMLAARRSTARPSRAPKPAPQTARPAPNRDKNTTTAPPPPSLDDDDPSGVIMVGAIGKTARAGESLSVLLAVTTDSARVRDLALVLAGKVLVRPIVDVIEMSEALEDHRGEVPVVLFDCTRPPFHLESVATFANELPSGSWLALLDGSALDEKTARGFAGSTLTLARISSSVGVEEIARRCLALFY
jgi:hypothetical protein